MAELSSPTPPGVEEDTISKKMQDLEVRTVCVCACLCVAGVCVRALLYGCWFLYCITDCLQVFHSNPSELLH